MADNEIYEDIKQCIADGDEEWARELAQQGLDQGLSPLDLIEKGFTPALRAVGDRWDTGSIFLPEMILSADAMKAAVRVLQPALQKEGGGSHAPRSCVVGTVKGDIHDIGKNLVGMMMEGAGFEVINLGINTPVEKYMAAIEEHQPDILGMSALLTTTMPYMKVVIDTLKSEGIRDNYIVMVGGAPLNDEFASAIGADAYCRDAATAVETAKKLVSQRRAEAA